MWFMDSALPPPVWMLNDASLTLRFPPAQRGVASAFARLWPAETGHRDPSGLRGQASSAAEEDQGIEKQTGRSKQAETNLSILCEISGVLSHVGCLNKMLLFELFFKHGLIEK